MNSKILVVDDSPMALMITRIVLNRHHFDVSMANDGREGVELAVQLRPDLILMDVVMPRLDGLTACKILRATPETKNIPIVILTSNSKCSDVEMAFDAGCDDYLTKPVDEKELLATIQSLLILSANHPSSWRGEMDAQAQDIF